MPLVTGTITPPPPPPPTVERLQMSWIAPDGSVWPLTEPRLGWKAKLGFIGWGVAPVTLTVDANPAGGATVRHVQPQPRLITMPLHITGKTQSEFLARWRGLAQAFAQTRRLGAGILTVHQPDGSMRRLRAYYQDGFDNNPQLGWKVDQPILTLFCEDPYWENPTVITVVRKFVAVGTSTFFSPRLHLTSSQTLGDTTITNPGDVDAYPLWTITGPATGITATRNDTGDSWTLTPIGGALTADDTVTISTDPPQILGPDATSWVAALNWPDAVLWPLPPGDTPVTFTVTGSAAGTSITLAFHARYETA